MTTTIVTSMPKPKVTPLLERLEKLTQKVKDCLDEDMTYCPVQSDFETLQEALLLLEKRSKIVVEPKGVDPKNPVHPGWKKVFPEGMGLNEEYRRAIEEANRQMGVFPMMPFNQIKGVGIGGGMTGAKSVHALHAEQGKKYGMKFMDAYHFGLMQNLRGDVTIYVGSDHAESFRHYLMDDFSQQMTTTTPEGKVTTWKGLAVRLTPARESRVQWDEGQYSYYVDIENPKTVHRTTRNYLLPGEFFR
jgi:hypothetical protein